MGQSSIDAVCTLYSDLQDRRAGKTWRGVATNIFLLTTRDLIDMHDGIGSLDLPPRPAPCPRFRVTHRIPEMFLLTLRGALEQVDSANMDNRRV